MKTQSTFLGWLKKPFLRLLGMDVLERRLAALENSGGSAIDAQAQNILSVLKNVTESIAVLDQKIGAYRAASILAQVSAAYPKKRNVIFLGKSYFGDNIKYAYLAFLEKAKADNIVCYFLPHDAGQYELLKKAGLPCLPYALADYTADDVLALLAAKVLVLDEQFIAPNWRSHTPQALLSGAKTVQLWHGIPVKKIGLETIAEGKIAEASQAEIFASFGPFDVFAAPGAAAQAEWARKFSFRRFAPIGYPRNDVFHREITPGDLVNVDQETLGHVQQAKGLVILYTPTFRRDSGWFNKAEMEGFADYCQTRGHIFYVNLHPCEQDSVQQFRQRYPRIHFIAPHTDIYPIVKYVDVLITDYSSLAYDFLLLDRPILFYRPDHEEYIARSRQLIADQDAYICGPVAGTPAELVQAFEATDIYQPARQALRQKLFDHQDGGAADRLYQEVLRLMESAS